MPEADAALAIIPHPEQLDVAGADPTAAAAAAAPVDDCLLTDALIIMTNPGDPGCANAFPVNLQGPTVVRREGPPYTTGNNVPIEIIAMDLINVAPTPLGPMMLQQDPFQLSLGQITNVVASSGDFVSGDAFFNVFLRINIPNQGMVVENQVPIQMEALGLTSLPPQPGTVFQMPPSQPPVTLFEVGTGIPRGIVCFAEHVVGGNCPKCVYRLTCATGPKAEMAVLGVCVGDLRTGPDCPGGTCPSATPTKLGNVCMSWVLVGCQPSTAGPMPGAPSACLCIPRATMPSSPTCPGEATCPGTNTCAGEFTCVGTSTCPSTNTCPPFPSCEGFVSCGYTATCGSYQTCPGHATCPVSNTCNGYITCRGSITCAYSISCPRYNSCDGHPTCQRAPTCYTWLSCNTSPTCVGSVSCSPPDPYSVVFSVARDTSNPIAAEGLVVPGHPGPNDVYALGIGNGYRAEGELFQASGAVLGNAPDATNVDRISATLGIGPAPAGSTYTGPFLPNAGGGTPDPGVPGGLGTFGLLSGDNINSLSFGNDGGRVLLFSVNTFAIGRLGTGVHTQAVLAPAAPAAGVGTPTNGGGDPGDEAAGDIFRSALFAPFGAGTGPALTPTAFGSNTLELDELSLGLQAPAIAHSASLGFAEDDLDALEASDAVVVDPQADGIVDTFTYFSLDLSSVQVLAATPDPFPGTSTVADPDGVTADDILITPPASGPYFAYGIYARGVADIGLLAGDELDALCLSDATPEGVLSAGDDILFSLRDGSPSLVAGANPNMPVVPLLSPGDVYRRTIGTAGITRYASSRALGLWPRDDVDAIDIGGCTCSHDPGNNLIGDACESRFANNGTDLAVPLCAYDDGRIIVSFGRVTSPGFVSASVLTPPVPPSASLWSLLTLPTPCGPGPSPNVALQVDQVCDISTDAVYADSIVVCIEYDPALLAGPEDSVRVLQYLEIAPGDTQWVDITVSVDTEMNEVCGVTQSLSQYALAEPVAASCACDCHADPAACEGTIDILDVVQTIGVAFRGVAPVADPNANCPYETTDVDCSSATDVLDVVRIVNVAFRGGNPATEFCDPCP